MVSPALREMTFDAPRFEQPTKVFPNALEAIQDLPDGATVFIDGFAGPGGMPHCLLVALRGPRRQRPYYGEQHRRDCPGGGFRHAARTSSHRPQHPDRQSPSKESHRFLSCVPISGPPQFFRACAATRGSRVRGGAPRHPGGASKGRRGPGVAAFYTPTGVGTLLAEGKEVRSFDGKDYVLEQALRGDFCLIRGHKADTLGNVVYKGTSRNFNSVMAPAARVTVIEVDEVVEPGGAEDPMRL